MKYPDIREFHEYKFLQQVKPTQPDLFYTVLADIKNVISSVMMKLGCGDNLIVCQILEKTYNKYE